jgi:hypothetical protein
MALGDLEPLEQAVLRKLLDGDHPVLAALRGQLTGVTAKSRERSGVGFFTEFSVLKTVTPAPVAKLRFGDVQATIDGLRHGAGFLLYVDDGLIGVNYSCRLATTIFAGSSQGEDTPRRLRGGRDRRWAA